MSIEEAIDHGKEQLEIFGGEHKEFIQTAIETMRKYQKLVNDNKQLSASITMMQADYNARLKADMVAMLTEMQMDVEECVDGAEGSPQFEQGVDIARAQVVKMIQQKINELKAESEDKE